MKVAVLPAFSEPVPSVMPVPEATIEVTPGAVWSMVAVKGVDAAPWLPAASVARAVSETAPESGRW